ncbi:MAG: AAA family ATPase, partial [Alphaproteobacteria bacterium]
VRSFLLGDTQLDIDRKFYGDDILVERAIVDLLGDQGLMLVGEPGTAKSMLSELLAAAISGRSNLTVQGSAGTTEDHIRYGWNYALLIADGPSERALIPSPVFEGMRSGRIVRIEEITRCPPEIQDTLISILSEKVIAIPELGEDRATFAAPGFNVIATANLRDRGVHEMSSALKRRFNFETVMPIMDPRLERELISSQLEQRLARAEVKADMSEEVLDLLVTTFQDLRSGKTRDGAPVPRPDAVMSTAEAVNVAHAAAMDAIYFGVGQIAGSHVARQLTGVVLKDNAEDVRKLGAYVDHVVKERSRKSKAWKEMLAAFKAQKSIS